MNLNNSNTLSPLKGLVARGEGDILMREIDSQMKNYNSGQAPEIINAFFYAVKISKIDMLKLFLDKGISPNEKNRYSIPALHVAISSLKPALTMELLIEKKASLYIRDSSGMEPLMEAARVSSIEAIDVLLKHLSLEMMRGALSELSFQTVMANAIDSCLIEQNEEIREYLNDYFLSWQQKIDLERHVPQSEIIVDNFKI